MITSIWKHIMKELGMLHTKENNVTRTIPFTDETESDATVADNENAGKSEATEKSEAKRKANRKEEKERKQPVRLTQEVRAFLQTHYDFRYNLLTDETEYRPAGMRAVAFEPVGKRELNTFCMEAHDEGISCWDKDLSRYVYSTCISTYHPFRLFIEELPLWDGTDRLEALARRVSDHPLWVKSFHTWMLGLTAQWAGMTGIHANSVAPIIVSSEQGRQKSTFCKALMPPSLSRYYMDNVKFSAQGKPEREVQRHNTVFYHPCPAEEVFHACFRMAKAEDEGCERLSASDIFRKLKKYNPAAMRGSAACGRNYPQAY